MIIILNHPIMHQKKTQQKYPPKNILFCEKYSIFNQIPPHVPRVPTLSLKIQYSNHHPLPPLLSIANLTNIFVFPPDCSRQGGMYQRGWGGLNRSKTDNDAQALHMLLIYHAMLKNYLNIVRGPYYMTFTSARSSSYVVAGSHAVYNSHGAN